MVLCRNKSVKKQHLLKTQSQTKKERSSLDGHMPVTVWYEGAYLAASGKTHPKVETIPWADGLTVAKATAAAGGYSTPAHRHIYLVRNGQSMWLSDPQQAVKPQDVPVEPGDRIEIRKTPPR